MRHHTKDKGDMALYAVMAHLMGCGYQSCLPVSEHLPFDLVAVSPAMALARVQVKFRTLCPGGYVNVQLVSTHADSRGVHTKAVNREEVDGWAIYCPEANTVWYVPLVEGIGVRNLRLRVNPARNGQLRGVRPADSFADPAALFWRARQGSNLQPSD